MLLLFLGFLQVVYPVAVLEPRARFQTDLLHSGEEVAGDSLNAGRRTLCEPAGDLCEPGPNTSIPLHCLGLSITTWGPQHWNTGSAREQWRYLTFSQHYSGVHLKTFEECMKHSVIWTEFASLKNPAVCQSTGWSYCFVKVYKYVNKIQIIQSCWLKCSCPLSGCG